MLVDSHCHLNYEGLVENQGEVLARARAAGVGAFLNISTRQREWGDVVATAEREPDVWASIGIHPHEAEQHADLGEAALLEAADHPRVIAIGESGLDYYYDKSDRAVQRDLFRTHIAVSRKTGLPLIIHTRDADEDTAAILTEEMEKGAFPALIHCFTASAGFGRRVLELGLTISISGIVTFKNARELQEFAAEIPEDRLLVETDSPFLAPVPHRGKTCEPAFVRNTAEFVAQLRGQSIQDLAASTTRNFYALFAKACPEQGRRATP
jgi:TatD DNase family protein